MRQSWQLPLAALLCLGMLVGADAPARAQDGTSGAADAHRLLQQAESAIEHRSFGLASHLLGQVQEINEASPDLLFLRGRLAQQRHRYADATLAYRRLLESDPAAVRVRLELARTLFDAGDMDGARQHFTIAASAPLPPVVAQRVQDYLARIGEARSWAGRFVFGLAPNTNVGAVSGQDTVEIGGIPFKLEGEGDARSDLGRVTGFDFTHRLKNVAGTPHVLRTDVTARHVAFEDERYNDGLMALRIGPELGTQANHLGLQARARQQWLGDKPARLAVGIGLDLAHRLEAGPELSLDLALERRTHPDLAPYDGWRSDARTSITFGDRSTGELDLSLSLGQETTREPHLDLLTGGIGAQALGMVGEHLLLGAGGEMALTRYGGADPIFGLRREDRFWRLWVDVAPIGVELFQNAPMLRISYQRNESNIGIHGYDRWMAEIVMQNPL